MYVVNWFPWLVFAAKPIKRTFGAPSINQKSVPHCAYSVLRSESAPAVVALALKMRLTECRTGSDRSRLHRDGGNGCSRQRLVRLIPARRLVWAGEGRLPSNLTRFWSSEGGLVAPSNLMIASMTIVEVRNWRVSLSEAG